MGVQLVAIKIGPKIHKIKLMSVLLGAFKGA